MECTSVPEDRIGATIGVERWIRNRSDPRYFPVCSGHVIKPIEAHLRINTDWWKGLWSKTLDVFYITPQAQYKCTIGAPLPRIFLEAWYCLQYNYIVLSTGLHTHTLLHDIIQSRLAVGVGGLGLTTVSCRLHSAVISHIEKALFHFKDKLGTSLFPDSSLFILLHTALHVTLYFLPFLVARLISLSPACRRIRCDLAWYCK